MPKLKALFIIILCLIPSACLSPISTKKEAQNKTSPIGSWSNSSSCQNTIKLQSNNQIPGKFFGLWEERDHIIELSLARNAQKGRQYVQILLTKPKQNQMQILNVIYPFGSWNIPYKKGDILKKCL